MYSFLCIIAPCSTTNAHFIMTNSITIHVPVASYGDLATAAALAGMDVNTWLARKLAGVPAPVNANAPAAPVRVPVKDEDDTPLPVSGSGDLISFADKHSAESL